MKMYLTSYHPCNLLRLFTYNAGIWWAEAVISGRGTEGDTLEEHWRDTADRGTTIGDHY
uniref:Uncharacterized protein n=1 Tax=Magallana gigas TaxID=29159 RepID=K1R379_MAGGI